MAVSYQEIGRRIAAYRSELRLSQEAIAKQMEHNQGSSWQDRAQAKAINAMELQGVCDALGLNLDALTVEEPRSPALAFMGSAKTDSAKQAIECVDRLAEDTLWQLRIARGVAVLTDDRVAEMRRKADDKEVSLVRDLCSDRRESLQLPGSARHTDSPVSGRRYRPCCFHRASRRPECSLHQYGSPKGKTAFRGCSRVVPRMVR